MIKKLKKRFIINVMLVLVSVFILMAVSFHFYYNYKNQKEDNALLHWIANTGSISNEDIEKFYREQEEDYDNIANIIAIKYDTEKNLLSVENIESLSQNEKEKMIKIGEKILKNEKFSSRNISYILVRKEYGYFLVIISTDDSGFFLQHSEYVIAGLFLLFVFFISFIISMVLSGFVTKPAEESLNKQKQFISDASHELRTPLAAIILNAEALRVTNDGNQNLKNILSESSRMEKLVSSLLELAKADDISSNPIMSEFDLSDTVLQITLSFESKAYESKINFHTNLEENLFYYGNCDDIKKVLSILLDNAFKHTNEGGKINVILNHTGNTKHIIIYNTGDGISERDLPHIFERFYSCDQSRNGLKKSYGLGLAIAKAIVDKHHGTISVKSHYGKDAEFKVELPTIQK